MSRVIGSFVLGESWPDWWADMVSANKAITYNDDGRWRGGPDKARISQGNGYLWAKKGDTICLHAGGSVSIIRSIGRIDLAAPTESAEREGV